MTATAEDIRLSVKDGKNLLIFDHQRPPRKNNYTWNPDNINFGY